MAKKFDVRNWPKLNCIILEIIKKKIMKQN